MAYDVKFLKGTAAQYNAAVKVPTTFYLVDEKDLYLGTVKLSNGTDLAEAVERISKNENDIGSITETLTVIQGDDTVENSIKQIVKNAINALSTVAKSGNASDVTYKGVNSPEGITALNSTSVEAAITELNTKVENTQTAGAITVEKLGTAQDGGLATYVIKQGGTAVSGGTINIPKDFVVKSASLKTANENDTTIPTGHQYIELIINTKDDETGTGTPIKIDVNSLVDVYTGVVGDIVEIVVSEDNQISGSIKEKSITKTLLVDTVQASLNKADSALQATDKTELSNSIAAEKTRAEAAEKVNADAIAILNGNGDGSVTKAVADAKTEITTAYEAADTTLKERISTLESAVGDGGSVQEKINTAIQNLDSEIAETEGQAITGFQIVDGKININTIKRFDAKTAAETAETNAKAYTDTALTWGTIV